MQPQEQTAPFEAHNIQPVIPAENRSWIIAHGRLLIEILPSKSITLVLCSCSVLSQLKKYILLQLPAFHFRRAGNFYAGAAYKLQAFPTRASAAASSPVG